MAVVSTGFFDGVHLGHRAVIETLLETARKRGEQSLVITFWPHPRIVLGKSAEGFRLLSSQQEKVDYLRSLGVDRVEVLPFTQEFASMTAQQYVQMLRDRFGVTEMVIGYDNRLGSDFQGYSTLKDMIPCTVVEPIPYLGGTDSGFISSSVARRALALGDVSLVSDVLGRPYSVCGEVVHGNGMGRTIDFPTANISLDDPLKAIPAPGVYATYAWIGDKRYKSMTNIDHTGKIETHILDFSSEIYGTVLRVEFVSKIRSEQSFTSLQELKPQLIKDRRTAEKRL